MASSNPTQKSGDRLAAAVLLGLGLLLFAAVEAHSPYYFLRDDNVNFHLPGWVYSWESLQNGEIPFVNPYQYLGTTHLAAGQTAVFYPLLYPVLALTELAAGDLRPAVDVFTILHLLAGGLGVFVLLRYLGTGRTASVLMGFLWLSFPFLNLVSRGWIVVAYGAAIVPWDFWLLERLLAKPRATRVLALAAVKALFFVQGYVQLAVLTALYESLYIVLRWIQPPNKTSDKTKDETWDRKKCWSRCRRQAIAWVLTLLACGALAAPMLLPMNAARLASLERSQKLPRDYLAQNAITAGPVLGAQVFQMQPQAIFNTTGAIYYVGLPNLLVLLALRRNTGRRWPLFLGVAFIALVLATAAYSWLFHAVPLLSSFRWPFKSFFFVLFFLTLALGRSYDRLFRSERRLLRTAGAVAAAASVAAHAVILLAPAWNKPFSPYTLDEDVQAFRERTLRRFDAARGRVLPVGAVTRWTSNTELLLFNMGTLAGVLQPGGYDPLVSALNFQLSGGLRFSGNLEPAELTPEAVEHLNAWSVRYLVLEGDATHNFARYPNLRPVERKDTVQVFENTAAVPFAFFADDPERRPVPVTWGSRVRLETGGRGGSLVLTIAPLSGYVWKADGVEMGAIDTDETLRVRLDVPAGTREVEVRYLDVPFLAGVGVALTFVLCVVGVGVLRRRAAVH